FCNRKTTVRDLAKELKRGGLKAGEIHGDMEQPERIRELDRFKDGEINILVASDVAARGLDIKDVSHVFNYDVPWHPDDYIHRIGRTGRAGKTGIAITLATSADGEAIEAIEKLTGTQIRPVEGAAAPAAAAPAAAGREAPAPKPRRERTRREKPRAAEAAEPAPPRPRPERAPARPARAPAPEPVGEEDGWNGPVPSFLGQSFGG
ncbi:MAG: hypothetical protein QOE79_1405, partial [Sphingomonadales bacterium]|nr:hypothetical protein [Sphingomonadales bacterium]